MTLPAAVLAYLNERAKSAGVARPEVEDDLFKMGVLDSFALVDFISILEQQCGIKIPDTDVDAANFQSINAIERYVESRKG
jgi:acyl carrier protein